MDIGVPSVSGREVCTGGEAPVRLELGKASQTRIRATTFPRAAHMCQVKRGFGSWQNCPEQGMDLGKAPAEALQGSREGGKVLAEIPSPLVFQRGCSYLSVLSWTKTQPVGISSEPRTRCETQGDLWASRPEVEGLKPPSDEHRGRGGLRLLFSHVIEQSPGEDRDI